MGQGHESATPYTQMTLLLASIARGKHTYTYTDVQIRESHDLNFFCSA